MEHGPTMEMIMSGLRDLKVEVGVLETKLDDVRDEVRKNRGMGELRATRIEEMMRFVGADHALLRGEGTRGEPGVTGRLQSLEEQNGFLVKVLILIIIPVALLVLNAGLERWG